MQKSNVWARRALCTVLLLGASVFLQAQAPPQFKADMQMSGSGDKMQGKIYFSGGKMRVEMAMEGQNQVMIMDPAKKVMYMLMPAEEMYMEMNANAPGPMKPPKVEAMDPANPCSSEGVTACKKLGTETVNGYASEKWEFTQERQKYTAWIATKLRMPIKSVAADGTSMELRNIVEGAQPANLFVVPADYEKMDMGGMAGMAGMAGMSDASDQDDTEEDTDEEMEATKDWDGTIAKPASIWEEGKGWVMNVTITAKGSGGNRTQDSETRETATVKYNVSVPLNAGQGVPLLMVGSVGPTWMHMPSPTITIKMGRPEALAKPITYSAEWEIQTITRVNNNMGCQGMGTVNSTQTETTKGKVEAKGSLTGPPSPFVAGMVGMLRIGPDLKTYGISVSATGVGDGSEQTTTKFEDHCDAKLNTNETSTSELGGPTMQEIEINDLPLPSSRTTLTGTKTIPWGNSQMDMEATVQWNISPL